MKLSLSLLFLCFTITIHAQATFSEKDAKQLVETFFEGFHKGDTTLMRSVLAKDVRLQTASANKEGVAQLSDASIDGLLTAIANRPEDQKWEEKLLGYTIHKDGNLAHVWTPYQFWFNGNFSHCGANSFTIAKTEAGWRIIHLIDSRRRNGCLEK